MMINTRWDYRQLYDMPIGDENWNYTVTLGDQTDRQAGQGKTSHK